MEKKAKALSLNRDEIKYIAIAAMFMGHLFLLVFPESPLMPIFNSISQITKITMAYFLVEGYFKTSSRAAYAKRLLLFGIASQPPYYLASGRAQLNIFFTLLICLLMIAILDTKSKDLNIDFVQKTIFFILLMLGTEYCEGSFFSLPILTIFLYYAFKGKMRKETAFFWGIIANVIYNMSATLYGLFAYNIVLFKETMQMDAMHLIEILWAAIILCGAYNGKKSKENIVFNKWFFYIFYPTHFALLYVIIELKKYF